MSAFSLTFPQISPTSLSVTASDPVDTLALSQAKVIVSQIRDTPQSTRCSKLLQLAKSYGDIKEDATSYIVGKEEMRLAYEGLSEEEKGTLQRIHHRVKRFAEAQRSSIKDMTIDIPGGEFFFVYKMIVLCLNAHKLLLLSPLFTHSV